MGKNKLPVLDFLKIWELFGIDAAKETLDDCNSGRVKASTITKYLYDKNETREQFAERIKRG